MMKHFFNKPQLERANLTQAAATTETGIDNKANNKAQQANISVDHLLSIGGSVLKIAGKYQENIEAKDRLASKDSMPLYADHIKVELSKVKDIDYMGSDALNDKLTEFTESFMKNYKDSPFRDQLKSDLGDVRSQVLTKMIDKRSEVHVGKVGNFVSSRASTLAQEYSAGSIDSDTFNSRALMLVTDGTLAYQVGTSTEVDLPDELRVEYIKLTGVQSKEAFMKGLAVQLADPENSNLALKITSTEFRKAMGIRDDDREYNKFVSNVLKKGVAADKLNYKTGLDNFKNELYTITNQGTNVDIDTQVKEYRQGGAKLTAQDEHKLRKEFDTENTLLGNSADYIEKLLDGRDITVGMNKKAREAIYTRSFTDVLGLTGEPVVGIRDINAALSGQKEQSAFGDYIQSGGKIPARVKAMFDVPAGSSATKWSEANTAIMSMEAAASGSGFSIESIIGVNQVSKVRGLSRLLNDQDMDEATKRNAIEAFHTRSTSFNSKGYLRGNESTQIDTEWLDDVSKDAPWTTDDYVSSRQNADEISGNYQAYRLAGHDESTAQKLALDLFNESNTSFEMPNGGEIVIPSDHKYLNNESILAFSKDAERFPSLREQRDDIELLTGEGWVAEWRADTNISIQKSYNFAKSGKYDMMYDGRLVKNSSFTYSELQDFISRQDYKTRTKITGVKVERPFKEIEAEALGNRRDKMRRKGYINEDIQHLFDLTI